MYVAMYYFSVVTYYLYCVLCIATLAKVIETCSTYIVIQILPINEILCGGGVTYTTTVSPSDGQIVMMNQTIHNITELTNDTLYEITVNAWRGDKRVHQTRISQSTVQPISKYVDLLYCMYHVRSYIATHMKYFTVAT